MYQPKLQLGSQFVQNVKFNYSLNGIRPGRWSFFWSDGMVNVLFQGTIGIDGFSMVLPALNHHH